MVNADFTYNVESANSIYKGVKYILDSGPFSNKNHSFKLLKCDHRGVNSRSDSCVEKFINDPNGLIMFVGLHSSPILNNIFDSDEDVSINGNSVLTLDPWAAAGAITRAKSNNWIFRLSVDDKYAGGFITRSLLREGDTKVSLFLVNNGWGKFNRKTMMKELDKAGVSPISIEMIDRDLSVGMSKVMVSNAFKKGARAILLVANTHQGKSIFKAIDELNLSSKIKIRSHWGITGGGLIKTDYNLIKKLDLQVLQTSFSFMSRHQSHYAKKVMADLISTDPSIQKASDLAAPVGFIHAHDLMLIVSKLISKHQLKGPAKSVRKRLKKLLETEIVDVQGLVKYYKKPFSSIALDEDGHDALSPQEFRMFQIGSDGAWIPVKE